MKADELKANEESREFYNIEKEIENEKKEEADNMLPSFLWFKPEAEFSDMIE